MMAWLRSASYGRMTNLRRSVGRTSFEIVQAFTETTTWNFPHLTHRSHTLATAVAIALAACHLRFGLRQTIHEFVEVAVEQVLIHCLGRSVSRVCVVSTGDSNHGAARQPESEQLAGFDGLVEHVVSEVVETRFKAASLEPKLSPVFTAALPPDDLKAEAALLKEIFNSPNDPTIPHTLQTANGYALFEIASVEAPALLPLDQIKPKIIEKLTAEALTAAVKTAADTARTALLESMKAGKTFAEAATAAGLTATEVPAFTKQKPPTVPNAAAITEATASVNPGEVSEAKEVPEGLILVSTIKRELPKDPKMDEEKKTLTKQRTEGAEGGFLPTYSPLFEAWFQAKRNETSAVKTDS